MSRSQLYDRLEYMQFDRCVDPLSSPFLDTLRALPAWKTRYVMDDEAGNLPLISYREYRFATVDLWWVIAEYNGIVHHLHLVAGSVIRLPSYHSIQQLFNSVARMKNGAVGSGMSSSGQTVINNARTLVL